MEIVCGGNKGDRRYAIVHYISVMPISTDNSVFDKNGRLLFCSVERFVRDICEGEHCFICGRSEQETPFNREHILPNWLLRQFTLHAKTMTLPNRERHGYGTYTIPCCVDCNSRLSSTFETPVSEAFASGFAGVEALIDLEGTHRLFQWLALIFLKLHLKDRRLKKHLDRRLGDAPISETYEWETFHHVHCLARAHYTEALLGDFVFGSFMLVQLVPDSEDEPFDVVSVTDASSLFLRAGDVALYAVLNDGQACVRAIEPTLGRITGPLHPMQARELAAELAAAKLHLKNPPRFSTLMSDEDGADLQMIADLDPAGPLFLEKDAPTVGFVKHFAFRHVLDRIEGHTREEAVALLKQNRLSFLFDDNGNFITGRRGPESEVTSIS
ncbi:hypothetical protein H5J25_00180 [Sphingomonas aliaeris]|uniref:HNH endonuclease n=1 Tax=Sphingomonas aliaeris TaxID=2759526 RepID=A0A974S4A3_9SPHN|nr:hypothetical protein [Sphingomonas aliaeris]QQV77306.1 hypothetical protein H5J25_00180 [Sphingomonas aliaeris]